MKVKCFRCGYEWDTKSSHIKVSCPSCYIKVVINALPKKEEAPIDPSPPTNLNLSMPSRIKKQPTFKMENIS